MWEVSLRLYDTGRVGRMDFNLRPRRLSPLRFQLEEVPPGVDGHALGMPYALMCGERLAVTEGIVEPRTSLSFRYSTAGRGFRLVLPTHGGWCHLVLASSAAGSENVRRKLRLPPPLSVMCAPPTAT